MRTKVSHHTHDSDCTLDGEYNDCTMCGIHHGEPCAFCGQRAYHLDSCNQPAVTDVSSGWSMLGHYYVAFRVPGAKGAYLECASMRQAEAIAEALKGAKMATPEDDSSPVNDVHSTGPF